jgi:acyl carrier protein
LTDKTESIARQLTAWVVEMVPGSTGIDAQTPLSQFAGFDSIAIVQLLAKAEDEFGVELADRDDAIESVSSVGALAKSIVALGGRSQ